MNTTNISTPAPSPAPAPAPSSPSPPMTTTTNLLSNALSIACEIPVEETNIMSFLDLREFLMTACTVVVFLTTLNALQGTLLKASKRIQRLISKSKNKHKVLPASDKKEKRKETEQEAESTAKDRDDDDDDAKEDDDDMKTKLKDKANEKIDEMFENANTYFDDKKDEIKEQHSLGQIDIILHIAQALCTIYSAVSYWNTYIPDLNGKDARVQILCRAAHLTILPLFKPISISM